MRLAILILLLVASSAADATTYLVPADYSTINAAIDIAADGDSILVGPGTWASEARTGLVCVNLLTRRSVMFLKAGLTIVGVAGPDLTILDGGVGDTPVIRTVLMSNELGSTTRLDGFTITGHGRGVLACASTRLEFVNCHFENNGGDALFLSDVAVSLENCVVTGNGWLEELENPAAIMLDDVVFEATSTRFESNRSGAIEAAGIARFSLDGCEFIDHVETAVTVSGCPDVEIRNSLFLRNRARFHGAALVIGSMATIEFCTFAYDSALVGNFGSLSILNSSSAQVRNNTFYRCYSPHFGSALGVSQSVATVSGNIAMECEGEAFMSASGSIIRVPESGCNVLWNAENYHEWPDPAKATDVIADPQFCDPATLDFTVRDTSPAAEANSGACGQIGAHGVGCGSVSIESMTWGRIKNDYR